MKPGQSAVIHWLDEDRSIAPRLLDLGFAPGTSVTCTLSRNNGKISAFFVRNALIALRQEDSQNILVELLSEQKAEENQAVAEIQEMNVTAENTEDTKIENPAKANELAENREKDSENCQEGM